jgi:hypothetical protein
MKRITDLKAKDLRSLRALSSAELVVELSKKDVYLKPSYVMEHCEHVEHRGLFYTVGHWGSWEGDFWVVEDSTGMIFRGPVSYIKEMISLCSAAHYEPNEIR